MGYTPTTYTFSVRFPARHANSRSGRMAAHRSGVMAVTTAGEAPSGSGVRHPLESRNVATSTPRMPRPLVVRAREYGNRSVRAPVVADG
jgi:hypothetical protein